MGIINTDFTMPGQDMPPQNFRDLKTQQGQINWLAQFLMSVNNVFDNVSGSVTTLAEDQSAYVEITFDDENNTATFDFYLPRGYRGYPGSMENVTATATTLAPGSSATVSVTLDRPTQSLAFSFGLPEGTPATDAQTASAVAAWIEAHPEAVTTVQDGAVSTVKLADGAVTLAKLASDVKAELDPNRPDTSYSPLLTAGVAESLLSSDEQQATFARRVSDGASVGVRALLGNTVIWNQLNNNYELPITKNGVTATKNNDGSVTVNGTATANSTFILQLIAVKDGHKYLLKGGFPNGGSNTYYYGLSGIAVDYGSGGIWTSSTNANYYARLDVYAGQTLNNVKIWPQVFELTEMFGAGNEPSTVAEFETLFPDNYYAYDAGSLLNVKMVGVESVGFNQFDEEMESGGINQDGEPVSGNYLRSKNFTSVLPDTEYYFKAPSGTTMVVYWYNADKSFNSFASPAANTVKTSPSGARYVKIRITTASYGTVYNHDICINLSDPSRNGTYSPYTHTIREIDTSEYFESGMKSAGSVYDELNEDAAIKRVGSVDMGTLSWSYDSTNVLFVAVVSGIATGVINTKQLSCAKYTVVGSGARSAHSDENNVIFQVASGLSVLVKDSAYTDAATFKTAMSGVMLYYELATPVTTEINPPINMDYPTQQGGIESIVIPEGEQSAPVTLVYVQGYDANGVANIALEVIAAIESNIASTNYAIGSFFIHAGKLYKATSAIASGETITPGTNCTQTTVMAEILALG